MIEKNKRQMTGLVISSKRDKTITVLIERKVKHPIYKKIRKSIAQLKTVQREAIKEGNND